MLTFQCLNVECEEESPVGAIDWIDDQHVTRCWLGGQVHALKQMPGDKDASIRFAIAGVVNDRHSLPALVPSTDFNER